MGAEIQQHDRGQRFLDKHAVRLHTCLEEVISVSLKYTKSMFEDNPLTHWKYLAILNSAFYRFYSFVFFCQYVLLTHQYILCVSIFL